MAIGKVFLVGAGPGDPDLLTVKAVRAIAEADVLVYDRLVPDDILATARDGVTRINVGKAADNHPIPQDEINHILVRLARSGRKVVRLKGGDPFIFGRGCEEAGALELANVPYEVIPGITAAQGCAASARVPLTQRGLATGVRFVTGHRKANAPLDLDWKSLADPETTLVVYMGLANLEEIARELIAHGLDAATPALAVSQATTENERSVAAPLCDLPQAVKSATLDGPVLFVIGRVAGAALARAEREAATMADAVSGVA